MKIKNLLIFCNANEKVGFGHISRCVNLSKLIESQSEIKTTFAGNFSETAKRNFLSNFSNIIDCDFSNLIEKSKGFDNILIDSYDLNQTILNQLTNFKKVILIDDFCKLNYEKVELVINFTISGLKFTYNSKNKALGLDFIIVNPDLFKLRLRNKEAKKVEITNEISIFMGGGFSDVIFYEKISKILHLKFGFEKVKILTNLIFETESYIQLIALNANILSFLENSKMILSGGGLMKYEAAFCIIPNLTISVTEEQDWETNQFQKENLTFRIGKIGDSFEVFEKNFNEFFENISNIEKFKTASLELFKNAKPNSIVEKIKIL